MTAKGKSRCRKTLLIYIDAKLVAVANLNTVEEARAWACGHFHVGLGEVKVEAVARDTVRRVAKP